MLYLWLQTFHLSTMRVSLQASTLPICIHPHLSVNPSPAPDSAPNAPDASAPIASSVNHSSDLSGLVIPD